jgi:transcriptional regulator with XRE-family HTH domain
VTQVQLAGALGLSQQTINSYEVGRRRIPVSLLPRLASTLGVSVGQLLSEERVATGDQEAPARQHRLPTVSRLRRARPGVREDGAEYLTGPETPADSPIDPVVDLLDRIRGLSVERRAQVAQFVEFLRWCENGGESRSWRVRSQ